MIVKVLKEDGSIALDTATAFGYDSAEKHFVWEDLRGNRKQADTSVVTHLLVYADGVVIFTRDLETMQPIEHFNV